LNGAFAESRCIVVERHGWRAAYRDRTKRCRRKQAQCESFQDKISWGLRRAAKICLAVQIYEFEGAGIRRTQPDPYWFRMKQDKSVLCSFGVAQYGVGDTAEMFVSQADGALYLAKINGRNRVELAPPPVVASPDFMPVA
jgi:GGDEF domain-containing protein